MNSLENNEPVDETVALMANIMNYLSVSMYEGSFKQCHQDALKVLNSIYDAAAQKPGGGPPSDADITSFYDNLTFLSSVTDTDDPTYWTYKKKLKRFIHT